MRFNFDLTEPDQSQTLTQSPSSTDQQTQWVPLLNHPIFAAATAVRPSSAAKNLMAWDGGSRLYVWDLKEKCLHRLSVRLGEPDESSVVAASPSKVLQADVNLSFEVDKISINRNGSALLLAGSDGLLVMYLSGRASSKERTIICRTVSVGSEIYINRDTAIKTLRIAWHPYSDTHLGILSSDSVFRIFDLSSALGQPEQEYYLQPVEPGSSRNASSICPVDFCFGGGHLWDRFSVFILFSDGSVYILCPVVPFGSVHNWESVLEIYSDAQTFGLKSVNSKAIRNSNLAISWLEAVFPELARSGAEGNHYILSAQPYAIFDASISLQGPLRKVTDNGEKDYEVKAAECEGRAVSFLYDSVSKDSILLTAWSGGQLQIDALADEIQPVWALGHPPRVSVDSDNHINGVAMICESVPNELSIVTFDQSDHNVWLGHPPPLLRLAIVDLALPRKSGSNSFISMFVDPLKPERIFATHNGGIDSIVLHFLPFTSQINGMDESHLNMKTPSVQSVLSIPQGGSSSAAPLCGFVALADSFGSSWIVGLTFAYECVLVEMETWNLSFLSQIEKVKSPLNLNDPEVTKQASIISKELLSGPKMVIAPPSSQNPVTADSIQGRSILHQYFNLFHENYVDYAHKVFFELKHHAPVVKKLVDEQHAVLREAQQKLLTVEEKQERLEKRIERAVQTHGVLEERLCALRKLPALHRRPLSKAEREFKMELDRFREVELDALCSSIEAVNARLKKLSSSPQRNLSSQRTLPGRRKDYALEAEISRIKSSVEKLAIVNSENTKKVKLVDSALKRKENSI